MKGVGFVLRGEIRQLIVSTQGLKLQFPDSVHIQDGATYISCSVDKLTGRPQPKKLIEQLIREDVSWSAYMITSIGGGMAMLHVSLGGGLIAVKDSVKIMSLWQDSDGVSQSFQPVPEIYGSSKLQIDGHKILCAATRDKVGMVYCEIFKPYLEITSEGPKIFGVRPKKHLKVSPVPPLGLACLGLPPDAGFEECLGEFEWISRLVKQKLFNYL